VIDAGLMFRFTAVVTLVTGTMFLMWLGEQVDRAWPGQRHLDHHLRRHRRGTPERHCRHAELVRTGAMFPLTALAITIAVVFGDVVPVCFGRQRRPGGTRPGQLRQAPDRNNKVYGEQARTCPFKVD